METIDIRRYIDDKNRTLYEQLVTHEYQISLYKGTDLTKEGLWECNINGKTVTVTYYTESDSTASFAHELYHADLIRRGFINTYDLITHIALNENLSIFYDGNLIAHINNIMAHEKFYVDFTNYYEPYEFDVNFNSESRVDNRIAELNRSGTSGEYVCKYIAEYFTAKGNFNPLKNEDFERLLISLGEKENTLFEILNNSWNGWLAEENLDNLTIINSLSLQVQNWYSNNRLRLMASFPPTNYLE